MHFIHSPNGHNSWGWARPKLGARNFILFFYIDLECRAYTLRSSAGAFTGTQQAAGSEEEQLTLSLASIWDAGVSSSLTGYATKLAPELKILQSLISFSKALNTLDSLMLLYDLLSIEQPIAVVINNKVIVKCKESGF